MRPRPDFAGDRPPIAVLLGGTSAEHDISIVSGSAIADALTERGWRVQRVLIDLAGRWWWLPADHVRGDRSPAIYDEPAELGAGGPFGAGLALELLAVAAPRPTVFVALHGPFGEDGTVQALLEAVDLVYTGSGVTASALGMDKALFKRMAARQGLPVVAWREVSAGRWAAACEGVLDELDEFARTGGDPRLMIKPARLGSSVGISLAHEPAERAAAIELALCHDRLVLAERYIAGARDLEVSVIGNDSDRLEVYGPGEILSGHEFYDFEAKYTPGLSWTTTRAEVSPEQRTAISALAVEAYRMIGAKGFARVDFFLAGETLYLNEINTIPGFTPISLFPTMAADGGYDFGAVCERIIELAHERRAGRARGRLSVADLPR